LLLGDDKEELQCPSASLACDLNGSPIYSICQTKYWRSKAPSGASPTVDFMEPIYGRP
jgi:hypothetical protein